MSKVGESAESIASHLADTCERTDDLRPREFQVEEYGTTWFLIEGIAGDWCDLTVGVVMVRPAPEEASVRVRISFHAAGPRWVYLHPYRENVMRRAVGLPEIPIDKGEN